MQPRYLGWFIICISVLAAVAGISLLNSSEMRFRRYADPPLADAKVLGSYKSSFFASPDPAYVWHVKAHPQNVLSRMTAASYFKGDEADIATAAGEVSDHVKGFVGSPAATVYWKRGRGYKKFVLVNSNDVYLVVIHF